ncbi:MAG: M23 family metallopeptidase [Syntrophomonadaceae bacterium]|nr:M23 family metallopeptidase [Syntrophomonadaceae bacterium]MDD3888596.1 M23 family metallopeptidase [Syntrophomonadaceae bacterium]MDD4549155.1 M23 family metallopeptidase [Syntrophomonadaceae bacterium]
MKRWIGSLVLCTFIITGVTAPACAGLNKGNFIPCVQNKSSATGSRAIVHYIKKGDTLWDISRTYNVDLQTIMTINNMNKKSILKIGQAIEIPSGSRSRVHIIRSGETMWDIAVKYDVTVEDIKKNNVNTNPRTLKIGDKLAIPNSAYRTAMVDITPSRGLSSATSYAWPLVGTITSKYGWRSSGFHHGLDIAGDIGDPVKASADGIVSCSESKAVYGRTVIIDHRDGRQTLYAHLQKANVIKGQKVRKGQTIGNVGITGRTTGPHLHFEIKQDTKTYDPLQFLRH